MTLPALEADHCSGCGRAGRLPDGPIFNRVELVWTVLAVVAASNFPDARQRYLCSRCKKKFDCHVKRLKAKTGWGHLR
jgi:hypothetical protein